MDIYNFDIGDLHPEEWINKSPVQIRVVCSTCHGLVETLHGVPDYPSIFLNAAIDLLDYLWKNESQYRGLFCQGTALETFVVPTPGPFDLRWVLKAIEMEVRLGTRALEITREKLSWTRVESI